uniref:Carboxylesterase type B domain-containing protein n=1 Tax=Mycena chlorophos TaxID=658473 RepID=A0ABQ0LAR3_MYCCL|nr:predicted protein [Mycena chlorophos]
MTSILFLNSPIEKFARAAIFESGSQATSALFLADRNEADWQNFVAGVGSCARLANSTSTFGCLREASTADLLTGFVASLNETTALFPWQPLIDGPGGLIPELPSVLFEKGEFAKMPFISGTNLDEGTLFLGTSLFGNTTSSVVAETEVFEGLVGEFTPSFASAEALASGVSELLVLYPDIPALGSPYGTGNDTFGLAPEYKQASAIVGDISFMALRRAWMEAAASKSVPTFGYLFTEPQPQNASDLGVFHSSEVTFVFGAPPNNATSALTISQAMINYWVSFADSLTPNDGLGVPRPTWEQWTPRNQAVIQLNGANLTMIPDTFRIGWPTFASFSALN